MTIVALNGLEGRTTRLMDLSEIGPKTTIWRHIAAMVEDKLLFETVDRDDARRNLYSISDSSLALLFEVFES